MAFYVRTIKGTRWFKYPEVSWLLPGEAPGDAVVDLRITDGGLSVYQADDKDAVLRTVAALAANRDHLASLDYSWFDGVDFVSYGIVANKVPGETPDTTVDDWHYDVVQLSAVRAARLADMVASGTIERLQKAQIRELIRQRLRSGQLDCKKVKPGILGAL